MVRWEKSFSMHDSVFCYRYICIFIAKGYKVRLSLAFSNSVLMQIVVAGEVMLTVVRLCERLVVPRCCLMWVWVERLRCNLVLLVRGPPVHRGTLHFDGFRRPMDHSLNMLDCVNRLRNSVGMRHTLCAIQSQHMSLNTVMLSSTVGLRREVVVPLVVLVLKVVHQPRALMVVSFVSVSVAAGVGMHGGLVPDDVPSRHMGSVVVASAPVRVEEFGVMDGLKVMILVHMRVVNNSSMMLLEAWANFCVDFVPGLFAIAKGVVLVVWLVDGPVVGLDQVGLHELVVAIVDIVLTIVMVPSDRILVNLCLYVMHDLTIVVLLHGGPVLTVVQVGVQKVLVRGQGLGLNVNRMVDFWLRHVVSFRMVLDRGFVLVVIRNGVMSLVRRHLVVEETRGAVNGKIIGNGRGTTVVRTSLSIDVVLPLVDLSTAVRGSLGVRGFLRL